MNKENTNRERAIAAIDFNDTDRVPIKLDGIAWQTMKGPEYEHNPSLIRYTLMKDGKSFGIDLSKATKKIYRTSHTSITHEVSAVEEFNRGVKRGETILVTGDRPRFAIMRTVQEDKIDPDFIKLGDCRIGIKYDGLFHWLDTSDDIVTVFKPSNTEYIVKIRSIPELEVNLIVSQAEEWGAVAKLILKNKKQSPIRLEVSLVYGGISRHGRTSTASYFDINKDELSRNSVEEEDSFSLLSDGDIPEKICAFCIPPIKPKRNGLKISFDYEINLANAGMNISYFIFGCIDNEEKKKKLLLQSNPEMLIIEASEYYEKLLSGYSISTSSKVLDSGFLTAILNLEYSYSGKLWLEGVHWWSSFFPMNFQISAAIALGELQKARKALDFLGSLEGGPCPILLPTEKSFLDTEAGSNFGIEEGLPYYINQLIEYYQNTGDKELILKLWENICTSIKILFERRGGNESGLLDWHLGCNCFLYQADFMALPNQAASPSIMVSGLLERLSLIANEIGKEEEALKWKKISKEMKDKLLSIMWNAEEGVFYSHIDYQNIKHKALYYTDMVFAVLYLNLPEEYKLKSLDALCDKLIYKTEDDRLMMRVGEFKPSIFGNDNVMPTQMCETARGFFEIGSNDIGFKLIESVALAGTIYTEAPGNFPERMDDYGKGEANYIFGNPTGSFIYSVISGLFGIRLKDNGKTLKCSPAFPEDWFDAHLSLPYSSITYKKSIEGTNVKVSYIISSTPARKLEFCVLLDSENIYDINVKNLEGEKKIKPEFRKKKVIFISSELADSFEVEINFTSLMGIKERKIKKQMVETLVPKSIELLKTLDLKEIKTFDLKEYYNSEKFLATSGWREDDLYIDLSSYRKTEKTIEIKGVNFDVPKDEVFGMEYAKIILLEHSNSDFNTVKTIMSDKPHGISIKVNMKAKAIALLFASECQSRHTGVDVGEINLNHIDGNVEKIVLNVGKNFDTLFSHFAEETLPVEIPSTFQKHPIHPGIDYINLLVCPCDFTSEISSVDFKINLPDVQLGLIGLSIFPREDYV